MKEATLPSLLPAAVAVALAAIAPPAAGAGATPVNGSFDADGTLSGIQTSITGWSLTKCNAGWQTDSPPGAPAPPTSSPNVALLNSNINYPGVGALGTIGGTELTSHPPGAAIEPGRTYTLTFDVGVRDQGQFGGGPNIIANLGTYSVTVAMVGSVDGVLASVDAVPLITVTNAWFPGSLEWDSTGAPRGRISPSFSVRRTPAAPTCSSSWTASC